MVDICYLTGDGAGRAWNISRRFGTGMPGAPLDVMLVQYLLYLGLSESNTGSGHRVAVSYEIGDIDGMWGPRSDAAWRCLLTYKLNQGVMIDDKYFDRIPPGTDGSVAHGKRLYKLTWLQALWFAFFADVLAETPNNTSWDAIMGLPDDTLCPEWLAAPLRAIRDASPAQP